jgi:hypothetical protein
MIRRALTLMSWSAVLAALLLAVGADNAMAATVHAADIGSGLAHTVGSWAKACVAPIAGLMGIGAVVKRDVPGAITLFGVTTVVGLFAYDPSGAQSVIHTIVHSVTGQ